MITQIIDALEARKPGTWERLVRQALARDRTGGMAVPPAQEVPASTAADSPVQEALAVIGGES